MNAAQPNRVPSPGLHAPVRQVVQAAQATLAQAESMVCDIVTAAFSNSRCPRSVEYRDGVTQLLLHRALGRRLLCPHTPGTAQADAWFAGLEEGKALWAHQCKAKPARGAGPEGQAQ